MRRFNLDLGLKLGALVGVSNPIRLYSSSSGARKFDFTDLT